MSRHMFYGAKSSIFSKARNLRLNETEPERILWEHLGQNKLLGFRFKRQHPIAGYIVDFYCHKAKLVIEIDGESHQHQLEYDLNRTAVINEFDIKVIRFSNDDVRNRILWYKVLFRS